MNVARGIVGWVRGAPGRDAVGHLVGDVVDAIEEEDRVDVVHAWGHAPGGWGWRQRDEGQP